MDLEEIKRGLRAEIKKRENEQYFTFQTNIRQMCKDVLNKLEEQEKEIAELKAKIKGETFVVHRSDEMSELKLFNSERIYWAVEQVERVAGDIDELHLDDSEFYIKSDADKVIAEKDAEIVELKHSLELATNECCAISESSVKEKRRLKRALYKACANWAKAYRYPSYRKFEAKCRAMVKKFGG